MTVSLKRGQIGKSKGIDITVKSSIGWVSIFAPTWEMVSGFKGGTIGEIEYTNLYVDILKAAGEEAFHKLWQAGVENNNKLTLCCYCPSGHFCHTHILISYAVKTYPKWFHDGRLQKEHTSKTGERMKYLLAIDLETTGLKASYHEITQIAAIMLDNKLNELGSFETFVRIDYPERGLEHNFNVFEYTGIKLEDLQKAPPLRDALRSLETFARSKINSTELKNIIIFGQNPTFDKGFLEAAFEQQGWKFPFDFHVLALESMYVHQHLVRTGELPKEITLKDICKVAGVENQQKHNAMSDIRATVNSLHKLCPPKIVKAPKTQEVEEVVKPTPRRRNVRKSN